MLIYTDHGVRRVLTRDEQQDNLASGDAFYAMPPNSIPPVWMGPDNSFRVLSLMHPAGPLGERKYWDRLA